MATNLETVKNLYEAFADGDVPTVLGAFHREIEWREAEGFLYADGNPYVGPQAVAEGIFQRIASDIEEFRVIPGNFIAGGDSVVAEGRYQGKMRATGAAVDAQFAHVWVFRDGSVIRFQQYTDTQQWKRAAGA